MKTIAAIIVTLNVCTLLLSCNQPKKKLPLQSSETRLPKLVWKTLTTEGKTMMEGLIPLHIYKNGIICNGQTHTLDRERLLMFNIEDGSTLWEWKDIRQRRERLFITMPIPCMDNILLLRNVNKLYGINVDNGTTIWEKRCADGLDISTLGTIFFYAADGFVWRGNIHTGQVDTLFFLSHIISLPKLPTDIFRPIHTYPVVQKNTKDSLIVITYCLGDSKSNQFDAYFLLYNISKRKVIYSQIIVPRSITMSGIFDVELYNNNLYFSAGRSIACHNLKTGKQLWKQDFGGGLIHSGMTIYQDKIIAHADESHSYTYALNPKTGQILWKEQNGGTMFRPFFFMSGVIYFVCAGDGLLHALDANTGKHIWQLECPGEKENSNDYFYGNVTGIDGKIFVRSGFHLYCYKVAQ